MGHPVPGLIVYWPEWAGVDARPYTNLGDFGELN